MIEVRVPRVITELRPDLAGWVSIARLVDAMIDLFLEAPRVAGESDGKIEFAVVLRWVDPKIRVAAAIVLGLQGIEDQETVAEVYAITTAARGEEACRVVQACLDHLPGLLVQAGIDPRTKNRVTWRVKDPN